MLDRARNTNGLHSMTPGPSKRHRTHRRKDLVSCQGLVGLSTFQQKAAPDISGAAFLTRLDGEHRQTAY